MEVRWPKWPLATAALEIHPASTPPPSPPSAAISRRTGFASRIVSLRRNQHAARCRLVLRALRPAAEQADQRRRNAVPQAGPKRRVLDHIDFHEGRAE